MARRRRSEIFTPDEIAVVHVMNRVARGAYLFGKDEDSSKDCTHRKRWMEERLELQVACFAIDLIGFSFLSNHFHQVLRSRPDIALTWSDREVARRWLTLCPTARNKKGIPLEPTEQDIARLCRDKKRIKKLRKRLSDISWWMRLYNQVIAQWVNREDKTEGRLWQGRFKAVRLNDEASILACMAYVDLNPIRAGLANSLEECQFTSILHRILSMKEGSSAQPETPEVIPAAATAAVAPAPASGEDCIPVSAAPSESQVSCGVVSEKATRHGFSVPMINCLSPVELQPTGEELVPCRRMSEDRCSDKGILPMTLPEYLTLLDWTARQIRDGSSGSTPEDFAPLFERLEISVDVWLKLARNFRRYFSGVAGNPEKAAPSGSGSSGKKFQLSKSGKEMFGVRA